MLVMHIRETSGANIKITNIHASIKLPDLLTDFVFMYDKQTIFIWL